MVSQGDALIGADVARADFGVDRSGVNIGIISDSFDCQEGYGTDVANGELPDDVNVVLDIPSTFGRVCDLPGTDEGRAIAQLIHDIAPGAGLTFHSNFPATPADMASAIDFLATVTGVDIIIRDLVHLTEPMFQDGLIAQAVNSAVASSSVVYIASAGNGGLSSYQADFDAGSGNENFFPGLTFPGDPTFDPDSDPPLFFGGVAHNFDARPGSDKDFFQRIPVPNGTRALISIQRDSPFFYATGSVGTANDIDVYILDQPVDDDGDFIGPTKIVGGSSKANVGTTGNAVEIVDFFNPIDSGTTTFNIMVAHSRSKQIADPNDTTLVEEAALILQQLPPEEAADLLEEVDVDHAIEILLAVDRESAGNILDSMSLERLIEIIERADHDTLIALLVEMSPEKFFLIPMDVLLANLPGVSVEILARELAPQPEDSLSGPTSQQISDVLVEYLVPRTIADVRAKIIGSPAPLDVVLAKFTRDLTLVRVVVEDFTEPPPNAPPLPPEDILNSIFTIELPDADADDISVAHVTLYVEREWFEENEIHPWTIRLNRLD